MIGNIIYTAISMCIGICLLLTNHILLFVTLAILFISYISYYHSRKLAIICTIVIGITSIYTFMIDKINVTSIPNNTEQFIGVVDSIPSIDGNKMRFIFKVNNEKLQVSYTIQTEEQQHAMSEVKPGMFLQINGMLDKAKSSTNDNAFDYREYLKQQHIHYVLKANSLKFSSKPSYKIKYELLQIRQSQIDLIEENFPKESAPFVEALIFGERALFDSDIERNYRELGLVHLLAISGSHISLLIVGGYFCLLRIGITKSKATVILLIILPIYMILAGASPSVVRAVIVGMIVLLSFFHKAKLLAIDILSIALILMLLINPYSLLNVGFQLSFVISFCLIVSSKFLSTLSPFMMTLAVTIIAQFVALPITLFNFYEISFLSIPLNLIFVPFISFIIFPLAFISLIVYRIPFIGDFILSFLDVLISISNRFLELIAKIPNASIIFGKPTFIWIIIFYTFLIVLFFRFEQKKKVSIILIELFVLLCFQYVDLDRSVKVTFIDVGQGDCILIQMKSENYMIDTGGTISFGGEAWEKQKDPFEVGKDTVVPYLKSIGVRKIDKLIITHGDQDHIGGATAIFDELKVEELVLGEKIDRSNLEMDLIEIAKRKGSKIITVGSGDSWSKGSTTFQILSPFGDEAEENSRSIVIYTQIGEHNWLFTGDLDISGEERIVEKYPKLNVDVLKVGHHGSNTSTGEELLEVTTPKIAIISVGENNRYGHPNDEVIERLSTQVVLRTDELGMISYEYRGGQGTFTSHKSYDEVQ